MKKLILLFIVFLSIIICKNNQNRNVLAQSSPAIKPQSEIRELRELTLSGSGYELGLQHGKQLKKEISEIVDKWKKNITRQLGRDANEILTEFFEYAQFTTAIKKWTPDLYDEVSGIADGAGQNFNDVFVLNLLDEFWVYLDDLYNHHCSDVGVPSINGKPSYIAQNMDLEEYVDGYQVLLRLKKTDKKPEQLILTHPGLIALNGLNETGIGVCVNTIMQLKASASGLPVAFVIRRIINSTDKKGLLHFIKNVPHASGQNYIIGIRGEVYDFEASANKVVRYKPGNKNGTVYHTNHPIVNTDLKEWFMKYHPELIDQKTKTNSNSHIRLESLIQRLANNSEIDELVIMESLRSKDDVRNPVCNTNSHSNRGFTFASVIMTLSGKPSLQITAGPPDESEYKRVGFTDLKN